MASRTSIRASQSEAGTRVQPEIFKHRLLQEAESTLNSLQSIWKEAGYEEIECQRLLGELLEKLKGACGAEVAAEQQILEHAKEEANSKSNEYSEFCLQLGRACSIEHLEDMNYTDRLAELERLINSIAGEVSERSGLLEAETPRIEQLVSCLGDNAPTSDAFNGPEGTPKLSDVRLQLMRQYGVKLEGVKASRVEEATNIAKDCTKHMKDMMYVEENFKTMDDSDSFYALDKEMHEFSCGGVFQFGVKLSDIARLTLRLKCFVDEKERRRLELGEIGAEIARLWTLLRVPSNEREEFQASFKMNLSMETLSKGVDELARLKEIRSKSMGKVINSIREDICALWVEAGIVAEEDQIEEFALYFRDVESLEDAAVDEHEAYFGAIRKRVEELRPLLQKVSRRETVVLERIELEQLQQNPDRLTARGPNAREARKREEYMATRVKNIDKITKELLSQIGTWECANGPFVFAGESYAERVSLQDEHYIEIRDSLRNARKKKDGKLDTPLPSRITVPV
jgi:hypothetical protein